MEDVRLPLKVEDPQNGDATGVYSKLHPPGGW